MATTIKRIYTLALAKIIEAPGTDVDFDSYSPTLLDSLLVEALPYENAIRAQRGDEELTSAPEITTIDSTVLDWDDRITRVALPWGLAAALLFDDENRKAESVMFRNEFVSALEDAAPAVPDYEEE
ncbi:MAG: hypothetical protein ACLT14_07380 [Butyricicoccaceae bacterium]